MNHSKFYFLFPPFFSLFLFLITGGIFLFAHPVALAQGDAGVGIGTGIGSDVPSISFSFCNTGEVLDDTEHQFGVCTTSQNCNGHFSATCNEINLWDNWSCVDDPNDECPAIVASSGTIDVNAILDGAPWLGSVNYTLNGPSGASENFVPQTFSNRNTGTYSVTYNSGGPSGKNFVRVQSSCGGTPCNLAAGDRLTFTLVFESLTVLTGTIEVRGIVDNAEQPFSVNYAVNGPSPAIDNSVPATFTNRNTGTYALSGISGFPSTFIFDSWDCAPSNCVVNAGQTIFLRMRLHTGAQTCNTSYPNDTFHVCYFDGTNPPTGANPVLAQNNESTIDHDWGFGQVNATGRSDQVSGIWRGRINFSAGNYVFHTLSDDGVALNLEGFGDIISNWTDHAPTQNNSLLITLPAGSRNVTLKWYENGGRARVKLWWDFTPLVLSCPDAPASITPSDGQTIVVTSDPAFVTLSWAATSDTAFYNVRLDDGTSERYHHPAWTSTVCGGSTAASPHYVCENGIFATSLAGAQVHPGKTYFYWVDPVAINPSCSYVNKGGSFNVVLDTDNDDDENGNGNGGGCNDECSSNASQCTDSTHVQTCGNFDGDSCSEWGPTPPNSCNPGEQCISGSCAALPPNPPASFTASAGPACNVVNFFWTDANSPPANSFTISCNSGAITISGLTGNSHTFTGAEGNTIYNCAITAVRSGLSSSVRPLDTGSVQTPECPDFGLACFDVGGGACSGFNVILSTAGFAKDTNAVEIQVHNAGTSFTGNVILSFAGVSGAASVFTVVPHFGTTTLAPGQTTILYVTVSDAQPIGTYNGFVNIKGAAPSLGTEHTIAVPLKVEVKSPGFEEI